MDRPGKRGKWAEERGEAGRGRSGMRPVIRRALALAGALLVAACAGPQSSLDAAGPAAREINTLGNTMYVGAVLITALVTVLMLLPFRRRRDWRPSNRMLVLGGGVALPIAVLTPHLIWSTNVGYEMRARVGPDAVSIEVTGHVFWWEVAYRRTDGALARTANEVRIPVGEHVEFLLTSNDVIHSFWIPPLGGKTDMIPGRITRMTLKADRPGVFRGVCAEYCGAQHSLMAFDVIAMARPEFEAWVESLTRVPTDPPEGLLREGRELFVQAGCASCHGLRGLSDARLGPDLTNVGDRRTIAAGTLRTNVGTLAGWISSAQHIKPGNRMPSYPGLEGRQLRALASYLESLK